MTDLPSSPAQQQPHLHAAWLIVPCLACDFLMMPVLTSVSDGLSIVAALGLIGCVLAQGNLLAAWLAWGDSPFRQRLLTHWKIVAGLYLLWLVGFGLACAAGNRVPPLIAVIVALGVPLVSLAAQFPLWIARQWFGWRLVRETADANQLRDPPLTIRDLMVATLIVATALALARVAPSPDAGEMWPVWGFAVFVASAISSISLLPAGPLLMRMNPLSRALKWSALYAAAWIVLPWFIVAGLRWSGAVNLPPWQAFAGLSGLMMTFAATLMLTAVIARDRGYRLAGDRQRPRVS